MFPAVSAQLKAGSSQLETLSSIPRFTLKHFSQCRMYAEPCRPKMVKGESKLIACCSLHMKCQIDTNYQHCSGISSCSIMKVCLEILQRFVCHLFMPPQRTVSTLRFFLGLLIFYAVILDVTTAEPIGSLQGL